MDIGVRLQGAALVAVRNPLYVIMVVSRTFARHNDVYKCRLVANGHKGRTLQNVRHSIWELEVAMLSAEGSGPPGNGPPGNGPPGNGPPGELPNYSKTPFFSSICTNSRVFGRV